MLCDDHVKRLFEPIATLRLFVRRAEGICYQYCESNIPNPLHFMLFCATKSKYVMPRVTFSRCDNELFGTMNAMDGLSAFTIPPKEKNVRESCRLCATKLLKSGRMGVWRVHGNCLTYRIIFCTLLLVFLGDEHSVSPTYVLMLPFFRPRRMTVSTDFHD